MTSTLSLSTEAIEKFYREGPVPLGPHDKTSQAHPLINNYLDAICFGAHWEAIPMGQRLLAYDRLPEALKPDLLKHQVLLGFLNTKPDDLEKLKDDKNVLAPLIAYMKGKTLSDDELKNVGDPLLAKQLTIWQRGSDLKIESPAPFFPISWKGEACTTKKHQALLVDAIDIDWNEVLRPDLLLLFPDDATLWHCLQFDPIYEALTKKTPYRVLTRVGEPLPWKPKEIVCLTKREPWAHAAKDLLAALHSGPEAWEALGIKLYLQERARILGRSRLPALARRHGTGFPSWQAYLKKLDRIAPRRKSSRKKPLNIVHVVPGIHDAPSPSTTLLRALLVDADHKKVEQSVFSTEAGTLSPGDYPWPPRAFEHSIKAGEKRLKQIRSTNTTIYLASGESTSLQTANEIATQIQEKAAQIVVFHSNDALSQMIACMTDAPHTVRLTEEKVSKPFPFDCALPPDPLTLMETLLAIPRSPKAK